MSTVTHGLSTEQEENVGSSNTSFLRDQKLFSPLQDFKTKHLGFYFYSAFVKEDPQIAASKWFTKHKAAKLKLTDLYT